MAVFKKAVKVLFDIRYDFDVKNVFLLPPIQTKFGKMFNGGIVRPPRWFVLGAGGTSFSKVRWVLSHKVSFHTLLQTSPISSRKTHFTEGYFARIFGGDICM